jgi:haloalkane dehalogenase
MKDIRNKPVWIDTDLYPFKSRFMHLSTGKMHYIDEGRGEVLLFIHGTPTWSFLYRDIIKYFGNHFRCIAIDHLGFGLSEKPAGFDGSPESHSKNLMEFISKMDLQKITLVVHDFGGPIGLSAAISMPDKFIRIVMFNTWLWETRSNPEAQKVNRILIGWLGRFLYLYMNFSVRVLLRKAFYNPKKLTKTTHLHYIKPFPNKESRYGLLHIGRSLIGSSDWYQELKEQLPKINKKPWLIVWGRKDNFIKPEYLGIWKNLVPGAVIQEFECGHFVMEEKAAETIEVMESFLNGNKL